MQHWNKNEGSEVHHRFYKGTHALSYSELSHKIGAMIGTVVEKLRDRPRADQKIRMLYLWHSKAAPAWDTSKKPG